MANTVPPADSGDNASFEEVPNAVLANQNAEIPDPNIEVAESKKDSNVAQTNNAVVGNEGKNNTGNNAAKDETNKAINSMATATQSNNKNKTSTKDSSNKEKEAKRKPTSQLFKEIGEFLEFYVTPLTQILYLFFLFLSIALAPIGLASLGVMLFTGAFIFNQALDLFIVDEFKDEAPYLKFAEEKAAAKAAERTDLEAQKQASEQKKQTKTPEKVVEKKAKDEKNKNQTQVPPLKSPPKISPSRMTFER
jgi:hypothetical protein